MNVHAVELRATFVWRGVVGLAVVSMLVVIGGFALHEALWRRVVGVSEARVVQFP